MTNMFGEVPLDSPDGEIFSNAYLLLPYAEYLSFLRLFNNYSSSPNEL